MAGPKETYEVELNPDQMSFVRSLKDQFSIANESKTLRIMLDYLISNPDVHDAVFTQRRCLRCE